MRDDRIRAGCHFAIPCWVVIRLAHPMIGVAMKILILFSLTALSATAAASEWKLVWSDEFDAPGRPDPANWTYETGMIRNQEKQFYTKDRRENARVADGKLIIEGRKESMEKAGFTSASLTTKGRGEWTYGRVVVRAKVPAARGTWPAIWMLPTDIGKVPWPKCGEIDIMEHVGYDPGKIHASLHTETFNHTKGTQRTATRMVPSCSSDFHVYSTEWTPQRFIFHIDGKPYLTIDKKPGDSVNEWPFDKPYYLILNLAIGGSWGAVKGIDNDAFPQRMEVDYVRVYQQNP
jgi:beta-glucanase (GH16 family)